MKRLLGSIAGNAVALYATRIVPGIAVTSDPIQLLLAGAAFGLFNWLVRGIAVFLSFPLILLSLGLFYFVLNGILLWAASFFLPGYHVSGLLPGILGALVISLVNALLHAIFGEAEKKK